MKITVECKAGQSITVSIDDETLVNHIGLVEEKPIEQETCKWKDNKEGMINPHNHCYTHKMAGFVFCQFCGKKIEVVK
jgi:hypothetical protein